MACFFVSCSTGLSTTQDTLGVNMAQTRYFGSYGGMCTSSFHFPSLRFNQSYKSQNGFSWNQKLGCSHRKRGITLLRFPYCCKSHSQHGLVRSNEIDPLVNGSRGKRKNHYGKGESNNIKKRFSLRLRSRLRLLAIRMKRGPIKSILKELGIFIRKNIRAVAFSTSVSIVLGLCYLFLKLTALPSPKIVPYSDLIMNVQSGSVSRVLLEEGSRRIYYNMLVEDNQNSGKELQEQDASADQDMNKLASDDTSRVGQRKLVNVLGKFKRTRASVPEWQYSTRKIDHDEKFLISLMREKGVTYSSAPQSALMSVRSTLLTVLTLWIPLIPLMWLLYRQLSAANSPARKQKPNSQTVGFDDVEGVDAAKVELMEVMIFFHNVYVYLCNIQVSFAVLLV